ncbi:MAG: hypothetical protein NC184_05535 [Roseburia sp.]|nr:hypothetical protein [Roseburia sp.]
MAKEIGKFNCALENCLTDADGSLVVSLRIPKDESYTAKQTVAAIRTGLASGKERLTAAFAWYKESRSLNANAYFHVLVDKIAEKMQLGADEVKVKMVLEYGTMATECGEPVIVALPKSANIAEYWTYAKWIADFTAKNGKPYSQYVFYKHTHTLDKSEMARLINGVVYEAQELGIETRTPDELASLIENWEG